MRGRRPPRTCGASASTSTSRRCSTRPTSPANFLGTRVFSRDPRLNAELGAAFVRGLQRGRVAATAKHFPGLGTAPLSTDTNRVVLDTPRGALDARLAPFARAIGAGVKLVMVSNAGLPRLRPRAASRRFSRSRSSPGSSAVGSASPAS